MRTGQEIDPQHGETRAALRVIGPAIFLVGLGFTAVGLVSFFSAFGSFGSGSFGPPQCFWCAFVGLPLMALGGAITKFAYMGTVARYVAGEIAPVGVDTVGYVAENTQESVRTFAQTVGQGLAAGTGRAVPAAAARCAQCATENAPDARFCKGCGAPLGKTKPCPNCRELNDPDAQFCEHCGHALTPGA